jgi:hypothetical protein
MWWALAVTACLWLSACSPVQRIAQSSNDIRAEAQGLIQRGTETGDAEVVSRATRIEALASGIHVQLSGVENKTSPILTALTYGAAAVVAVALVILLWQTGIGTAIRVAIGWLPRRKVVAAELAVDMLDPNRPEGDREYIAVMRAQDPMFDAAFRKAQTRRKA